MRFYCFLQLFANLLIFSYLGFRDKVEDVLVEERIGMFVMAVHFEHGQVRDCVVKKFQYKPFNLFFITIYRLRWLIAFAEMVELFPELLHQLRWNKCQVNFRNLLEITVQQQILRQILFTANLLKLSIHHFHCLINKLFRVIKDISLFSLSKDAIKTWNLLS